jgi:hypothetical protein
MRRLERETLDTKGSPLVVVVLVIDLDKEVEGGRFAAEDLAYSAGTADIVDEAAQLQRPLLLVEVGYQMRKDAGIGKWCPTCKMVKRCKLKCILNALSVYSRHISLPRSKRL